jgi:transposase
MANAEHCRREGIAQSLYYSWSKEFLEAGKRRLAGDTARQATSPEVKELRAEATALKEAVADLTLENRLLKNVWPAPLASRLLLAGLGRAQTYPA